MKVPAVRLSAVAVLAFLAAGCGIQQVQQPGPTATPTLAPPTPVPTANITGGPVAASVNGAAIPMTIFKDFVNYQYRSSASSGTTTTYQAAGKSALAQLIEYAVASQEAAKDGVAPKASDIQKRISQAITQSKGKAGFRSALAQQGLTERLFRYLVRGSLAETNLANHLYPIQKSGPVAEAREILIAAKKPISAAEAFFTRPVTPQTDKCTHKILTYGEAKTKAQSILSRLKAGGSFTTLAKSCSDDTYSSSTGGYYTGMLNTRTLYPYAEQFAPDLETAIFTDPVGEYRLISSLNGWDIIQVTSRHHATYPSTVNPSLGVAVTTAIQDYHFQSWLVQKAEAAYPKTKVYEHVS